jgi:hypothetical protein
MDDAISTKHTTRLVLTALEHAREYWVQFEPEGGMRNVRHGDRLTITFTGEGVREIEIYAYEDGIVIWRPLDSTDITIVDQTGDAGPDRQPEPQPPRHRPKLGSGLLPRPRQQRVPRLDRRCLGVCACPHLGVVA